MSKKLINIKDIQENIFYQLPKQLFYSETYRTTLSANAKILYAIIRDRFNSSLENAKKSLNSNQRVAFVDKNGDVYCIVENHEIEYTLNITDKTVTKIVKELTEAQLIKTVRVPNKPKRIYLYALESDPLDAATFFGKKDYYSYVRTQKKKKQPIEITEEEFVTNRITRLMGQHKDRSEHNETPIDYLAPVPGDPDYSYPENENVNIPVSETAKITSPVGVKIPTPGDVTYPSMESENIRHNDTDLNNIQENNNHINDIYSNKSSSKDNDINIYKESEEELLQDTSTHQEDFNNLETILNELGLFMLPKDRNVIKKTLRSANIYTLTEKTIKYAIVTHRANVIKMQLNKGKVPNYEPAYFANNLVDRYFEAQGNEAAKEEQISSKQHIQVSINNESHNKVEFYNWLEERDS